MLMAALLAESTILRVVPLAVLNPQRAILAAAEVPIPTWPVLSILAFTAISIET